MVSTALTLDLLADYLEPQFGNIYDHFDWTPELQQAVAHYLLHQMPADVWQPFLAQLDSEVPLGPKAEQVAFIIARHEPWDVSFALNKAIVRGLSFDQLLGGLQAWPAPSASNFDDVHTEDATLWLEAHGDYRSLLNVAQHVGRFDFVEEKPYLPADLTEDDVFLDLAERLPTVLTPPQLLSAWQDVVGPALSDLTDDEWQLLLPLVQEHPAGHGGRMRSDYELLKLRHAFDGIRYKFAQDIQWTHLPDRYGTWESVRQRYVNYRDRGDFARIYQKLEGWPGAERLATWLKTVASK